MRVFCRRHRLAPVTLFLHTHPSPFRPLPPQNGFCYTRGGTQGFHGTALCCVDAVACIWIGSAGECRNNTFRSSVVPLIPWLGQAGFPHQIAITLPRRAPALVDCPYH